MPYQPIENHGVVGNLCTVALVGLDGCVDYMCFPEFDSPTIFATLLDEEKGGFFALAPEEEGMRSKQMYVDETNILTTRFLSEQFVSEITDYMPVSSTAQRNELVRVVRAIHGESKFRLQCRPAFDYARCKHKASKEGQHVIFQPDSDQLPKLVLRGTVPFEIEDDTAHASFTLSQGERAYFALSAQGDSFNEAVGCEPVEHIELKADDVEANLEATLKFWRDWIGKSTYRGRWRETVNRSALILKLMVSRAHGAMVAAPTFGLPEFIGGGRNWDYRYTWIRDSAFTLYAFMRLGLRSEADAFFEWLRKMANAGETASGAPLQIMYGLDGRKELKEESLPHLAGYCNSSPVRIGNGAFNQIQLDIYGELFDAVYLYSKYGHALPHQGWIKMTETLDWLGANWSQPDEGIWEIRGGHQQNLHSRLMCWVAFDRAIRLAQKRSLSAPLTEWFEHRDAIVRDIYTNFWDEEVQAFTQHKGSSAMDAAVLLMPLVRFISPVDPQWLSTLHAIEKELSEDALVYRYRAEQSPDGLEGEEGSFTCCGFWLVESLARAGEVEKARRHFEQLLTYANHLGLFSEEIGRDGHQLGNFPQALSHLALISAAFYLDRALSGKPAEPWSE